MRIISLCTGVTYTGDVREGKQTLVQTQAANLYSPEAQIYQESYT